MKTIRVVSVIGTRPEAVKMAPLFMELRSRKEIELKLVVTGQHKEMLNQVLESFEIEVDVNLHIMKHKQSLTSITVDSIAGLEPVLRELNPHIVLVHGDTTTTLAASLAAFYQQIQIGHVEAGLRTGEKFQPYPEEMNRKLTGALADWHYAPTFKAKENLLKEKVDENTIILTGNTAIDALEYTIKPHYTHPLLSVIGGNRFLVLTTHRRENVGAGMREVFFAVKKLLTLFPDLHIVYPVHKNPKIHEIMKEMAINHERLHLTEPLDTVAFHNIASRASIILTDSGGIQEEAPSFGVPVLVLRDQTERPEGVEAGVLKLVGTDSTNIIKHVAKLLSDPNEYKMMSNGSNPYGDGKASQRIADHIVGVFSNLKTEETLVR